MAIVESVVGILLQKLTDPLIREAILLHGVGDQVQWLEAEFRRMQCFLEDADAKQGDRRVKGWVGDVRDVAYDAEDVIDDFLFKVATLRRTGFVGCIKRYACIFNELIARHKMGSKIERLKIKIRAISESRSTYGIENLGQGAGTSSAGRSHQEWRLTSPLSQESDFVGFEKDMERLVEQLIDERELRRCVVSVVGMGGLGKTTLTHKLYNTDSVKKHFHSRAWISVSQEYSVRDLLQAIVRRCMDLSDEELKKVEKMDVVELRDKVIEYLNDKRYLIVLDDIWTTEAWDALKDAFLNMNNGSRVVLTTRNKDVALYAGSQPYELGFLNDDECWELFCNKAFPGRNGRCPQNLEEFGRKIVEKCHHLPLAIVVIGGLLLTKEASASEWEKVYKSINWQLAEGHQQISGILSLSYKDLPYSLKPCFLYLGNFPEDREFRAKELIQMWAAEGFLQQRGEETLEEVGEDCLKELIQRSMVQLARRNSRGNIKSCRIHDLLRDLSISEAKESMFLQVHSPNANAPPASRARRLAINDSSEYISLSRSTPHLRSVLMYTHSHGLRQGKEEKFLFRGFKLLRVLYIHGACINKLPEEIGELIHLRYLGCTLTYLTRLPSSIGNLTNLQTLFVVSNFMIKVPSTIGKMQQLRHFRLKRMYEQVIPLGYIEGRPRLDRINSLQTLSFVTSGKWMEEGCLGKLTNLKKLGIWVNYEGDRETDAKVLYESIVNLNCLHCLRLGGDLHKLPDSSYFPINLTKLTLIESHLKEDPMAKLEKLKNLRILRLLNQSYMGNEMACSAQGFPLLESLYLRQLNQLEEWRVEEESMPSLLHLFIDDCTKLKKLPEGLQHVRTLNKLELLSVPDELKARLEEDRGEDWYKIQHIPSINIERNLHDHYGNWYETNRF